MIQSEKLGHIDADIHSFLEFTKRAREDDKKDAIEEKRERRRLSQLAAAAAAAAKTATTKQDQKDDSPNLLSTILKGLLGGGALALGAAATRSKPPVKAPPRKFADFDADGKVKGPGQAARGMTGSQAKLAKINADIAKARIKLELERVRAQQALLDDIQKQVETERARVAQQKRVRAIADRNKLLRDMTAFDEVEQTATQKAAESRSKPTVFDKAPDQQKYNKGDTVKYTQRNGTVVDKIIKRIDPSGRIILSHANGSGAFVADPERLRGGGTPPVTRVTAPKIPKTPALITGTAPTIKPGPTTVPRSTPANLLTAPAAEKPPAVSQRRFGFGGARPTVGGPGSMPASVASQAPTQLGPSSRPQRKPKMGLRGMLRRAPKWLIEKLNYDLKNTKWALPFLKWVGRGAGLGIIAIELYLIHLVLTDQTLVWKDDWSIELAPLKRSKEQKADEMTAAWTVIINGTVGAVAAGSAVGAVIGAAGGSPTTVGALLTSFIGAVAGGIIATRYGPQGHARALAMAMAGYSTDEILKYFGITRTQQSLVTESLTPEQIADRAAEYTVMQQNPLTPFISMAPASLGSQLTPASIELLGGEAGLAGKQLALQRAAAASRAAIAAENAARSGSSPVQSRAVASNYATSGALAKALNDDLYNTVMQNNPSLGVSIIDAASMDALANAIVDALAAMPAGGGGGGSRGLQLISAPPPIDLDAIGPQ